MGTSMINSILANCACIGYGIMAFAVSISYN